jgi:hypothetical protein
MKHWLMLVPLMTLSIASYFGLALTISAEDDTKNANTTGQSPQADVDKQRRLADQQTRPELEKQRKEAQQQAEKLLDKEAIAAIDETDHAIHAIAGNKPAEALDAIERATGKISILLARNPATAFIPVSLEVRVFDTAPKDGKTILAVAQDAARAMDDKNYPAARTLLFSLMSEIRVRTYNLPLATYPTALKEAARLLDQKKNSEASNVLLDALNTLVALDKVTPIPIVLAKDAINQAQAQRDKDKQGALKLLETAKNELERSKQLGYAGRDPDYTALNDNISNLEKQLNGNQDTASVFVTLKEKLASFLNKQQTEQRQH